VTASCRSRQHFECGSSKSNGYAIRAELIRLNECELRPLKETNAIASVIREGSFC